MILAAFEALVAQGASPAFASRVASMRSAFEARTGAFTPDDAWFEVRSRAFWDDTVTCPGFARDASAALEHRSAAVQARALAPAFERAHRGLFLAERAGGRRVLRDVWSGAAFVIDEVDEGTRDALAAASAPFDARVVGAMIGGAPRVALLPGAVFHPADAIKGIDDVLAFAREAGLTTGDLLDGLLRMERSLRSLTRVKAAYAYHPTALKHR
jgi:hypothetical protein